MPIKKPRRAPGHPTRCAERHRLQAHLEAGGAEELPAEAFFRLVLTIESCCGHARLKCFRLAHGWDVNLTVRKIHQLAESLGTRPLGLTSRSLLDWEAGAGMRAHYLDLLCRAYRTGPVQLGLAADYTPALSAGGRELEMPGAGDVAPERDLASPGLTSPGLTSPDLASPGLAAEELATADVAAVAAPVPARAALVPPPLAVVEAAAHPRLEIIGGEPTLDSEAVAIAHTITADDPAAAGPAAKATAGGPEADTGGGPDARRVDLSGEWWAAWQTYRDGKEYVTAQRAIMQHRGDLIEVAALTRGLDRSDGGYLWRGQMRICDNQVLLGWYAAVDGAVRSMGTIYFVLHTHGINMTGRWTGLSYDGPIVSGWGAIAYTEHEARGLVEKLRGDTADDSAGNGTAA